MRRALIWAFLGLLLVGGFSVVVAATPRFLDRAVDAPDAPRVLYDLGGLESNGQETFRWSSEEWGIALFGFARPAPVILTIQASAARPLNVPAAEVSITGSTPTDARFEVMRGWRTYRVLTYPSAPTSESQLIGVRSSTYMPAVSTPDASHDRRVLGIAVKRVRVQQLPTLGTPAVQLTGRALFLASITLVAALALTLAGLSTPLVVAATLALAALLGALQLLAAPTLGYWLPNAWYLLGGAALLVLAAPDWRRLIGTTGALLKPRPAWPLGFALGLGGTLALWMGLSLWVGLPLAVGGAAVMLLALAPVPGTAVQRDSPSGNTRRTWITLVCITLVALALRLYRLNTLPIALWRDEVYHGQLALEIWHNPAYRPIYVPSVDLPALLFYLIAPVIGTFGPDIWTLRIVPALAGSLTPLACWFALRPIFGARVALIAAWCMAVYAWGLYMSRWAFPVIFDPLFVLVAVGCCWRGLAPHLGRRHAAAWMSAGGLCTGLAMYTYHTGRLAPLIVALMVLARLLMLRREGSSRGALAIGGTLAVGVVAFVLTVAPLGAYAIANPADFSKRVNDVNIFKPLNAAPVPPLNIVQDNVVRYALMWHVEGDQNARHYAPGRPVLDPISGILFLLGAGTCILTCRTIAGRAILLWLGIGLIPGILSDAAPHAMRSIGALAPACALTALGLDALLSGARTWVKDAAFLIHEGHEEHEDRSYTASSNLRGLRDLRGFRIRDRRWMPKAAVGLLLAVLAVWNVQLYFRTDGDLQVIYYPFDTTQTVIARSARIVATTTTPAGTHYQAYVWNASMDGLIAPFLADDAPIGRFDGSAFTPAVGSYAMLIVPGDMPPDLRAAALRGLGPQARLLRTGPRRPGTDIPVYMVYGSGPEAAWLVEQLPLP